ncbi:hypothetical protein EV284_4490 [Streptomyces sp. BK022]|uniref:hypothetical protein n=1 Tax=Streptomyces sp. BK022 TaxID=2512123 RepID=UPI001029F20A|nr:hypothetical protein [Streptomyces sp. BK022]RZU34888.1 hypothetical protein EV284_4490 [Streptomyces sp. BK022]
MSRGRTLGAVLALFAVALLSLQLFAPTGPFTTAHTLGEAKAHDTPGIVLVAQPSGEGADVAREPGRSQTPPVAAHTDRHRQRGAAPTPAPERPFISRRPAEPVPPARSGAPDAGATRSSGAHSTAVLQVFRC